MTQSETEELKPCPFCGGTNTDLSNGYDEDANWVVICRVCKSSGTFCVEKATAVMRWNTRAPVDSQGAELAREAYDYFMGPQACGDFTCACGNAEACGVCEIRQRFERWLGGQPDESPAATQMRTACVEKVKECLAERARTSPESEDYEYDQAVCYVLYGVIDKLSALTLGVKQKEQS